MSFLVSDIFSLPSMEHATLLSGETGLQNIITSVGIADNFDSQYRDIYQGEPFLKNRLMLSALLSNWTVEKQCTCLRFLHRSAASGLILFQMPDCVPVFDPSFFQTSDELGIPVIQMPPRRWSYSEIIDLIMGELLHKGQKSYKLSYVALMKLASIPKSQHNEANLLRLLAENAQVSIALYDGSFVLRHQAVHNSAVKDIFEIPEFRQRLRDGFAQKPPAIRTGDGRHFYYALQRIFLPNSKLKYVVAASEKGPIPVAQQVWISEAISFFFVNWGINKYGRNTLAQSILDYSPVESRAIAKSLHMKLEDIVILYLYFPEQKLPEQEMSSRFTKIEQYFKQLSFRPIMTMSDAYIAVFLEAPGYPIDFQNFTSAFQAEAQAIDDRFFLFAHIQQNLAVQNFFSSVIENMKYARKVYPRKKVYTLQELQFVQTCMDIIRRGPEAVNHLLASTKPCTKNSNLTGELWNTLMVFLLDADGKIETAASYLYIHASTVKYRLKRISECLGYNIYKMPESYQLYMALAVMRLKQ